MISKILFVLALVPAAAFAQPHLLPASGGLQVVHARDGREVMADAKGLTVYTFDPDKADVSVCYDDCAKEWPPVVVAKTEVVAAPFATAARKDGSLQLTYDHKPLYNFDQDKVTGDILGDGDDQIWHVIVPAAAPEVPAVPAPL
jgi:predicted lipoprotein with Yx(FWY)xxD motif